MNETVTAAARVLAFGVLVSLSVPALAQPAYPTRSGRLKPLAISGETRSAPLPQVPTMAQAGLPAFEMSGWSGMFAPAGTPKYIIDNISGEMARILASPEIAELLSSQGLEPFISNPEQFAALLRSDMVRFAKLIKDANIKVEQ